MAPIALLPAGNLRDVKLELNFPKNCSDNRFRGRSGLVRVLAILSAFALPGFAVGCAGTEVDEKRAREAILYDVEQKTGVEVEWVSCPSGVPVVPGNTFECRVKARDGRLALARLEVLNEDADVRFMNLESVGGR